MKEREVIDSNKTTWHCVQAYAGVESKSTEQATALVETKNERVPVVCTPSGGAQSVRLQLAHDWSDRLSDDDLVASIVQAQH